MNRFLAIDVTVEDQNTHTPQTRVYVKYDLCGDSDVRVCNLIDLSVVEQRTGGYGGFDAVGL